MLPLKQILLIAVCGLIFKSPSIASGQQQSLHVLPAVSIDTLLKKDSLNPNMQALNDPKLGFKDLFITAPAIYGINTEKLNPLAVKFVQDYIGKFGKSMEEMRSWGKPYFDMMDGILIQHGLPKELKYLAVIESFLKSNSKSWAGAVGPWQFMPVTARNFGLRVSRYYDERTDYFKSTHAASRYLTDLFSVYGDWLLVIAAYNGGPGNVNYAIRKSGSRDFWVLQNFLPAESRNHVKKFIATHYIMESQGGITTATKNEANLLLLSNTLTKEDKAGTRTQVINGRYNSLVILKYCTMDLSLFNQLNPDFDKLTGINGNYELCLPNEKMDIFLAKRMDILNESVQLLLNPVH